jgi:hypothetical protein
MHITKEEWLKQARPFSMLSTTCYEGHNTTLYLHIFSYQLGFFLKRYHSVEKFMNYTLKSQHCINKIRMQGDTNGFWGGPVPAATQQLNAQKRLEHRATTHD